MVKYDIVPSSNKRYILSDLLFYSKFILKFKWRAPFLNLFY